MLKVCTGTPNKINTIVVVLIFLPSNIGFALHIMMWAMKVYLDTP